MKNRNKVMLGGLMALALGLGVSPSALAFQGDYSKRGPNYNPEFAAKMAEVMTKVDYEAWKNLVADKIPKGRDEVITKDNFAKFAEAWRLAKEGKIKEANILRKELGLRTNDGQNMGNHKGYGMGHGGGRFQK